MHLIPLLLGGSLALSPPQPNATSTPTDRPPETPGCRRLDTPGAAARCAIDRGPALAIAEADVDIARAHRDGAKVLLPSNPTLDLLVARRRGPSDRDVNVYGTLRQEVEIAGQRRLRMRVADAEIDAGRADVAAVRRTIAAEAMLAYYDVVAAQRLEAEIGKVVEVARALETLARERVDAGAAAGLELELTRAARVVAARRWLDARRRAALARAALASLVAVDDGVEVGGELRPLESTATRPRPELEGSAARIRAWERRTAVIRRDRVPEASFVATVQRDGFGEFVAGGGVSLGIPLPAPLGRTARAEITASRAEARRARGERERVRRSIDLAAASATAELAASRETLALYEPTITKGAHETLDALGAALAAGQLELRDALLAQQSLLELLAGQLEAEHRVCIAAVELAHASGADLEAVR